MLNRLKDLFESLQNHKVKYVVIGGIAAVLYGVPRATFDCDILVEANLDNIQKLLQAFIDAGIGTAELISAKEVLANEITIFNDRIRVDVQTWTPGITFSAAWKNKVAMDYQGQVFYIVSRHHLIDSKRAAGRKVDIEDTRLLELGDEDT